MVTKKFESNISDELQKAIYYNSEWNEDTYLEQKDPLLIN